MAGRGVRHGISGINHKKSKKHKQKQLTHFYLQDTDWFQDKELIFLLFFSFVLKMFCYPDLTNFMYTLTFVSGCALLVLGYIYKEFGLMHKFKEEYHIV